MKVIREINRGSFGLVEEVEMPDGTRLARKIFSPSFPVASQQDIEKFIRRFQREVRVQSSLEAETFIPILSEGVEGSSPYYLMPLADKTLRQEIVESKKTGEAPQQALADILNALEELHELGYVHRDLKPENVLSHGGKWKLSDFGLVLPPSSETTKLTSSNSNWGTARYCAPEQAIEFKNATPLVDIYAFGCILHDIYGIEDRIPYQRYSSPGEIGGIIEKCTEIKPEKRFHSVRALRGALFTLFSSAPNVTLSPAASDWVSEIKKIDEWDRRKAENFVRFLTYSANSEDRYAVLIEVDESVLDKIYNIDQDIIKSLSILYCEWVEHTGFQWDYCDVVVRRLEKIFELGDIELKAMSALAAAELGKSHNRWFVMRRLMNMCGKSLDDTVARRIAIEINAREVESNFIRCAAVIQQDANMYHTKIAEQLTDK